MNTQLLILSILHWVHNIQKFWIFIEYSIWYIFSRESDSTIANVRPSVCLSVTKTPQPLRITPTNHRGYRPSSLLTVKPIDHQAYWPSSPLIIKPINLSSSFATFKPFGLFKNFTYTRMEPCASGFCFCAPNTVIGPGITVKTGRSTNTYKEDW